MENTGATDRWNRSVGDVWTQMLRGHRLGPAATVVEIGPGFTDKIARALAALNFHGTVVLVEPNEAASAWALERYRRLLPQAETIVVQRSIFDAEMPHRHSIDALVSNHILDDLILNAALSPEVSTRIFARMQPGAPCSRMFVRSWNDLLKTSERLERLISQVAEDFTNCIAEVQPRLVLLNQYPSWRHNLRGLSLIHTQALRLMQLIESNLKAVCMDAPVSGPGDHTSWVRWLIRRPTCNT